MHARTIRWHRAADNVAEKHADKGTGHGGSQSALKKAKARIAEPNSSGADEALKLGLGGLTWEEASLYTPPHFKD